MKAATIFPLVINEFAGMCPKSTFGDIYIFGSILTNSESVSDIDILIIYRSCKEILEIKNNVSILTHRLPIAVMYMTPDEEREFNFIEAQKARSLDQILMEKP